MEMATHFRINAWIRIRVLQPETEVVRMRTSVIGSYQRKHLGPRTLYPSLRSRAPGITDHAITESIFPLPESAHRMKLLRVLRTKNLTTLR